MSSPASPNAVSEGVCSSKTNQNQLASPSTIRNWLFSLSKLEAIYAIMIIRFGTKSDGLNLRKSAKKIRQKAICFIQLIYSTLLPQDTVNSDYRYGDYSSLFMFFCSCIEYFSEQLMRTANLYCCFRLSSIQHPKWPQQTTNVFVYSGFTALPRKRKHVSTEASPSADINITQTRTTKFVQSECPISKNRYSNKTINSLKKACSVSSITENVLENSKLNCKFKKVQSKFRQRSDSLSTSVEESEFPSIIVPEGILVREDTFDENSLLTKCDQNLDIELVDLEALNKDIDIIKDLIVKICNQVPNNPWLTNKKSKNEEDNSNFYQDSDDENHSLRKQFWDGKMRYDPTSKNKKNIDEKNYVSILSYRRRKNARRKCVVFCLTMMTLLLLVFSLILAVRFSTQTHLDEPVVHEKEPLQHNHLQASRFN